MIKMTNPETLKRLGSLYSVLNKKAGLPSEQVLDPHDHVISSDHTIAVERQLFNNVLQSFIEKEERILKGSSETFSPSELEILKNFCDRMRKSEFDGLRVKKLATETNTLIANKFDAAQVLSIVKQIPNLVARELDTILMEVFSDVVESINDKENNIDEINPPHPLLGKMRAFEVSRISSMISERLAILVSEVNVPTMNEDNTVNMEDNHSLQDVEEMLGSLIVKEE